MSAKLRSDYFLWKWWLALPFWVCVLFGLGVLGTGLAAIDFIFRATASDFLSHNGGQPFDWAPPENRWHDLSLWGLAGTCIKLGFAWLVAIGLLYRAFYRILEIPDDMGLLRLFFIGCVFAVLSLITLLAPVCWSIERSAAQRVTHKSLFWDYESARPFWNR